MSMLILRIWLHVVGINFNNYKSDNFHVYESLKDIPHNVDIVAIIKESIHNYCIIDEMELDCILVADAGLGTINSVVLTYEYMKNRNMNIKGMIFNHYIADNIMHEDNIRMCEYMTGLPTLAKVSMGDVDLNIDIAELISLYR